MESNTTRYPQLAVIETTWDIYSEDDSQLEFSINMSSYNPDQIPCRRDGDIISTTKFRINVPNVQIRKYMKLQMKQIIFQSFPQTLWFHEGILVWNIEQPESKFVNEIINKLLENLVFVGTIEFVGRSTYTYQENDIIPQMFSYGVMNQPKYKWLFKMLNKNSNRTLERISLDFLAKCCMNKVFESFCNEGLKFFVYYHLKSDRDLLLSLNKISFLNALVLIDPKKILEFNRRFKHHIQGLKLELNCYLIKKMYSYCPKLQDFSGGDDSFLDYLSY